MNEIKKSPLIESWFDAVFNGNVFDGPTKSYFEIACEFSNKELYLTRGVYKTYSYSTIGGEESYKKLETAIALDLSNWAENLRQQKRLGNVSIFWRVRPQITTDEVTKYGVLWMTYQEWLDAGEPEIPNGFELGDDGIRFVEGKYLVSRIYMRFATLPDVSKDIPSFKEEGFPSTMI